MTPPAAAFPHRAPYPLARLLTSLDYLSRGRIAWNVVTSYKREEALNFGRRELLDHDQRLAKPIIGDTDEAAQQRADTLYAHAPVEAGLAALSTLLQIDLSAYELDQPLPASIQERAIQGIRSQLDRFYLSGRTPTLRDIATRKVSLDSMPFIGTPQRVAESPYGPGGECRATCRRCASKAY